MNHKDEITQTRIGGLGSSDAKMVATVGKTGQLTETAKNRIAVMLGLIEKKNVSTAAMENGNVIEAMVFASIKTKIPSSLSNPYFKSVQLSEMAGFDVFNHIDIEVETDDRIAWYENKATIKSIESTMDEYIDQLAWHWMLLNEKAEEKDAYLILTHYDTSDGSTEFNPKNLTTKSIAYEDCAPTIEYIKKGLLVIAEALPTFEYVAPVEVATESLPASIQEIMPKINHCLRTIEDANARVEAFKEELKKVMEENGIKSVDNEFFRVTYVPEGLSARFDSKTLQKDDPDTYAKYLKNSKVKSQIRLTLK